MGKPPINGGFKRFNGMKNTSDILVCKFNRGVSISMFDHQRVTSYTAWVNEKTLPAIVNVADGDRLICRPT
jgi:hypothetical protein